MANLEGERAGEWLSLVEGRVHLEGTHWYFGAVVMFCVLIGGYAVARTHPI